MIYGIVGIDVDLPRHSSKKIKFLYTISIIKI